MLNELIDRIEWDNIDNIIELQKSIPKFNGNISGFYDLFSTCFNAIKKLLNKNSKE